MYNEIIVALFAVQCYVESYKHILQTYNCQLSSYETSLCGETEMMTHLVAIAVAIAIWRMNALSPIGTIQEALILTDRQGIITGVIVVSIHSQVPCSCAHISRWATWLSLPHGINLCMWHRTSQTLQLTSALFCCHYHLQTLKVLNCRYDLVSGLLKHHGTGLRQQVIVTQYWLQNVGNYTETHWLGISSHLADIHVSTYQVIIPFGLLASYMKKYSRASGHIAHISSLEVGHTWGKVHIQRVRDLQGISPIWHIFMSNF